MSEAYEGVVFRSDERAARHAFITLVSPLRLRLVRLGLEAFGIYRVADRAEAFDLSAVEQVAVRVSAIVSQSVALYYDNSCGIRVAVAYADGRRVREFGDGDALWVQLDDRGEAQAGGPRFRIAELRPDSEYECIHSAIDAGLESVGAGPDVSAASVKQAFCYDEAEVLAVTQAAEPGAPADGPRP
jgi:hypothetical protein